MPYQFVREPLRGEEADLLCQACETTHIPAIFAKQFHIFFEQIVQTG